MDWLINNYQWIFSGIGIFIIGLVFAIFKKRNNTRIEKNNVDKSKNPIKNEVKAKYVNINQTVISDSITRNVNSNLKNKTNKYYDPEFEKIKDNCFGPNNKLRTFLIKQLAKTRQNKSVIEIRHITDIGESELGLKHDETVHELEKIEEEGLIQFILPDNEIISPYTRIRLTDKYFKIIEEI